MFGGFAGVALMIAVVGVAGVLAFSVSARTREFGVRLPIGSSPRHLLVGALRQGAVVPEVHIPGALPIVGAAILLATAAVLASAGYKSGIG